MILIGGAFVFGLLKLGNLVPSARLEGAARELGTLLTRVREMAVFQGSTIQVEYDLDDQRYRMLRPTTAAEQAEGAPDILESSWFELPANIRIQDVQVSDRETVTSGTYLIEFSPTGEVFGHLVHLISDEIHFENRKSYTVELNPITGLVSYTLGEKSYQLIRDEYAFR